MSKFRKLMRREHRYRSHSGKSVIVKPKNFDRWKQNKAFSFNRNEIYNFIQPTVRQEKIVVAAKMLYRSLIQVRFQGTKKKSPYTFLKLRLWINDVKLHSEQELRRKLHDILPDVGIGIGAGIGMGHTVYDVAYEHEEISSSEADNIGKYQSWSNFSNEKKRREWSE